MLRHSWLMIYRKFLRFKSTFFINLAGLSSGLLCALLILLWVSDELSVDKFQENRARLFQVMTNHHNSDGVMTWDSGPGLLAEGLVQEMPEIEYAVSTSQIRNDYTLSADDSHVKASGAFASENFFKVFSYDLLQGDKSKVLVDKNSVVISEKMALNLFKSTTNVVGKAIEWWDMDLRLKVFVSGVFKDVPANSSDKFDFLLSYEVFKELYHKDIHWKNHNVKTYLLLKEGTDMGLFNAKIAGFIKARDKDSSVTLFARSYADAYMYGRYENGVQAGGRIEYVRLFTLIAVFILLIACINFMNLSTAKASARIREVGIKKALGAQRKILIFQYMGESILVTFISLIVALIFVALLLPKFNEITDKQLTLNFRTDFILAIVAMVLITGVIAGSYPSLYLSGFSPAKVLKGKLNSLVGEVWARKGLVVFQFTISIVLIVSVLVIYRQIEFIQGKNLGYNKDNIIYFTNEGRIVTSLQTFLQEVKSIPNVVEASSMWGNPAGRYGSTGGMDWEGKAPDETVPFGNVGVNYNLIELLGIKMVAGRSFSKDFAADSAKLILNEAALKTMDIKDPVGRVVNLWGKDMEIIGVTQNFHFASLTESIKPFFFRLAPQETDKIMVRIAAGSERQTIQQIQNLYESYNPGFIFNYKFVDEDYQALYVSEKKVATLSKYFAVLAIMISCLGLYGLAAFTAERMLKEIGIRKVLGATQFSIVYFLSSNFTKLVSIAIVIGLPLSYFIAGQWLDGFAYRIDLQWWFFLGTGLVVLLITWLTVGVQAIKASRVNPLKCLRDE